MTSYVYAYIPNPNPNTNPNLIPNSNANRCHAPTAIQTVLPRSLCHTLYTPITLDRLGSTYAKFAKVFNIILKYSHV